VKSALEALIISLLVVAALTPAVRVLALRLGAVAHPGGRHVHERSIPRLGGVAICVGFAAAILALYLTDAGAAETFRNVRLRMLCLFAGGLAMCCVGVIDDTRGIRAAYKLAFQMVVAVFSYSCGFRIAGLHLPLVGNLATGALSLPLTVVWIVGIINAINLIDGLDGLAAGVVFFAAITNLVVAYLSGAPLVALLSGAIAGSVLGFLFYNFNPARIFMGDSGSYFLGYLLATTALISTAQKASTAISLLVPILALGVPIFDTLFAMVRRILERRSVFSPDRGHIHHRLLDMGLTQRRAVIIIYAVCGVFTAAAIGVSLERTWQVGAALLGATTAMIGLVRFVGYFEYLHLRLRQKARLRSRDVELLRYAVPDLPRRCGEARTEAELLQELWRFAGAAGLELVEVLAIADPDSEGGSGARDSERCVHRWPEGGDVDASLGRDMLTARYALGEGAARGALRFGWHSDFGDISAQSEILLQVAADVLAENLARVGSALAPASVAPQEDAGEVLRAV
jgi:UDP-GlcNAc:undecaprenyl-phosphate/decaprenyl-phosphate GlcNAc-1-phosphate transferase